MQLHQIVHQHAIQPRRKSHPCRKFSHAICAPRLPRHTICCSPENKQFYAPSHSVHPAVAVFGPSVGHKNEHPPLPFCQPVILAVRCFSSSSSNSSSSSASFSWKSVCELRAKAGGDDEVLLCVFGRIFLGGKTKMGGREA